MSKWRDVTRGDPVKGGEVGKPWHTITLDQFVLSNIRAKIYAACCVERYSRAANSSQVPQDHS